MSPAVQLHSGAIHLTVIVIACLLTFYPLYGKTMDNNDDQLHKLSAGW